MLSLQTNRFTAGAEHTKKHTAPKITRSSDILSLKAQNNSQHTKVSFDKLILVGNSSTNTLLNTAFDRTFYKNDATGFIGQVNKLLPPLHYDNQGANTTVNLNTNYLMYGLPASGSINNGETSITVTKEGKIQLSHNDLQNILVNKDNLNSTEWQENIWNKNVYNYIPGFRDLPIPSYIPLPGRSNISNKEIISGGIRFLDPWPQSSWEKTALKRNWPSDPYTTAGPLRLTSDYTQQAILMDTNHPSCINVGKTYGVKPRALVSVNPYDSSVILAVQQENINTNPTIALAPWIIAPIKTPADKKALAIFPVNSTMTNSLQNSNNDNLPDWIKSIQGNNKWKVDSENDFIILDPAAPGQQSKLNTSNTNWAAYAIEGSDKVIVMRSLYNHPDQFQAFIRKSGNTGKSEYLEVEYTGPKVTPGNKSTVVIKWDFIPVSTLTNGKINKFGETGNLQNEVTQVSRKLKELIPPVIS
jgi:hypothetical protein